MQSRFRTALWMLTLLLTTLFTGACQRGKVGEVSGGPTQEQLITFYSPRAIKILPFTKPRSFDDDNIPDGIGVSMRALDGAGDPVKVYGTFHFELFAFRQAIGQHRGQSLQTWDQVVSSLEDQKKFWSRVTSTYEFQLSWEGTPLSPQKKYILTASFQAPGAERLFDEYTFEFKAQRDDVMQEIKQQSAK
jgi:hypothetical protein